MTREPIFSGKVGRGNRTRPRESHTLPHPLGKAFPEKSKAIEQSSGSPPGGKGAEMEGAREPLPLPSGQGRVK